MVKNKYKVESFAFCVRERESFYLFLVEVKFVVKHSFLQVCKNTKSFFVISNLLFFLFIVNTFFEFLYFGLKRAENL